MSHESLTTTPSCTPIGTIFIPSLHHPTHALIFSPTASHILHRKYHIIGTLIGQHPRHHTQRQTGSVPVLVDEVDVRLMGEEGLGVVRWAVMGQDTRYGNERDGQNAPKGMEGGIMEGSGGVNQKEGSGMQDEQQHDDIPSHIHSQRQIYRDMLVQMLQLKGYYTPVESNYDNTQHALTHINTATTPTFTPATHNYTYISPSQITWNPQNDIKYRIFRDLWRRGFFMTGGMKFGVDWLLYEDDAVMLHARYMLYIVSWNEFLEPQKMNAMMRLAVTVKKTILMAAWDEEHDCVRYMEYRYHSMKKQIDSILRGGAVVQKEGQVEVVANADPVSRKRKEMDSEDEHPQVEPQQKKRKVADSDSNNVMQDE